MLIVFTEATIAFKPAEGAFDDPSLRQDVKSGGVVGALDDLKGPCGEDLGPFHELTGISVRDYCRSTNGVTSKMKGPSPPTFSARTHGSKTGLLPLTRMMSAVSKKFAAGSRSCHALSFPITVIGAGAIDSAAVITLAKMGCSDLTVWDDDTLAEHNVSNQLCRLDAIGNAKVYALATLTQDPVSAFRAARRALLTAR